MNCSCRTAALRIFVRNITHIRVPVAAAGRIASHQIPFRGLHGLPLGTAALPRSASRSLHTTCVRRSDSLPEASHNKELTEANTDRSAPSAESTFDGADAATASTPKRPRGRGRPKKEKESSWAPKNRGLRKEKEPQDELEATDAERTRKSKEMRGPSLLERLAEERDQGRDRESWKIQKAALKKKFPEGWRPPKRLSPDALAGIRALHAEFPKEYTSEVLAQKFEVSPEAIRRILKSNWTPKPEEEIKRQERWFNRGKSVYARWAEVGIKPPRKWREVGVVRDPIWNETKKERSEKDREARARAHTLLSQSLM